MSASRRQFLSVAAAAAPAAATAAEVAGSAAETARVSLDGAWEFRPDVPGTAWSTVKVPHTWQIMPGLTEHMGAAVYRRQFDAPPEWSGSLVRLEFEAVFHSAVVSVNGQKVGEHQGKGYTAFAIDITGALRFGQPNNIEVRVDNGFRDDMLPRGRSSDWTHDGGIYRPVWLLVTPKTYIERLDVDALPDLQRNRASVAVHTAVRNGAGARIAYRVVEDETGRVVASGTAGAPDFSIEIDNPKLWHFDHPHLYRLEAALVAGGKPVHRCSTGFGIRRIEVRNSEFYLNGERVALMGVERMAGSNPEFGMAEPSEWIAHDHADMKELNCVFTRVHWQQDRRVLDYCDRHGMLLQLEVPTWGPNTFRDTTGAALEAITNNGLEQLREMIARDRNHPCIFSWGLCNEVDGQNPSAQQFVRRMAAEARKLDPHRLLSYASNSLHKTPERDVAGELDFIEWNEYYESWYKGTVEDMRRNLEQIHAAFPNKPVVISEYGYCACAPGRPEDDARRAEILRTHDKVFRAYPWVGGLIFFCYNDYRTHIGDKGTGAAKQRIHGVVDLYGARKPSYEELRRESSPVAALDVSGTPGAMQALVRARNGVPAYTLDGYQLRWIVYAASGIPVERASAALPRLAPGQEITVRVAWSEKDAARVRFDVMRPTGFSALTAEWKR